MIYLFIGAAGAVGALARYGIGLWVVQEIGYGSVFATLPVNLIGCLILGWFTTYSSRGNTTVHPYVRACFGTGFLGSFTTFSTFSMEMVMLLEAALWLQALTYLLCSLWGGLLSAWLGRSLALAGQHGRRVNP